MYYEIPTVIFSVNFPDNSTKHLTKLLQTYNFTQTINEPIRTTIDTETLIDHVITNRPDADLEYGVITCELVTMLLNKKQLRLNPEF